MVDIILINPHGTKFVGDFTLPLGLLQSAVYINENYDVKLLDLRVKPDWEKALLDELKKNTHFVGISTITGPNLISALEISKVVKENSNALVVWGGIHASLLPGETIKNPLVDIVVKGEGEETFNELADAVIHNKPLKNGQARDMRFWLHAIFVFWVCNQVGFLCEWLKHWPAFGGFAMTFNGIAHGICCEGGFRSVC